MWKALSSVLLLTLTACQGGVDAVDGRGQALTAPLASEADVADQPSTVTAPDTTSPPAAPDPVDYSQFPVDPEDLEAAQAAQPSQCSIVESE